MSLLGLKSSGFVVSIGVSLLLTGLVVYYIKQKMDENDLKMQNMLNLIQQMNSMAVRAHPQPPNAIPVNHTNRGDTRASMQSDSSLEGGNNNIDSNLDNKVLITNVEDDLIDVSDNDSDISCTTEDDDDLLAVRESDENDKLNESITNERDDDEDACLLEVDDSVQHGDDNGMIDVVDSNNVANDDDDGDDDDDDDGDDDDDDDDDDHDDDNDVDELFVEDIDEIGNSNTGNVIESESTKSIQLTTLDSNDEDAQLDNILMNQLTLAKEKTHTGESKYGDTKVSDLRNIIKENMETLVNKGVKVQNISKLKKNECIEILGNL